MTDPYDAVLLVSFGGPERPDDVLPFLENVLRGTNVPKPRMLQIAKRYELFDGVSPANGECRALLAALVTELNVYGPQLPVYWGNRNWHPLLGDALKQMADDGIRRALAFVTSPFGSYSGCRQYREDIQRAREATGAGAPEVDKLRLFYNHPGFIEPVAKRVETALAELPAERRAEATILFTAHSLPSATAEKSPYPKQFHEACRLVADCLGRSDWQQAYQSRSGPPSEPWLKPDIADFLRELAEASDVRDVVLVPIGFQYENMELIFDLDVEVADLCDNLGLNMVRSAAVGSHPRFVTMIRELIRERIDDHPTRLALGTHGPSPDICPANCCPRG